jgi:hypothetical protein
MTTNEIETYLVEVGLKKIGPAALGSAVAALLALLAAHQGVLQSWGITVGDFSSFSNFHPTGQCILIELDTVSTALLAVITTVVGGLLAAAQHHTIAAVTGAPQSGNMRVTPDQPVIGGARHEDPPKGAI